MRATNRWLTVCLLLAGGCGDDGEKLTVEDVLTRYVVAYDREASATCECQVASGAFDSMQACLDLLASGPSWLECVSASLEGTDAESRLPQAQCAVDAMDARARCLETAECAVDATRACYAPGANGCEAGPGGLAEQLGAELVLKVLIDCPDTGLLSRLDTQNTGS